MRSPSQHPRHGWRHVVAAFGYSMAGGRRLLAEPAGRLHCIMMAVALMLFLFVGASPGQFGWLAVAFAAGLCVEALNTAIEEIVDRTSPEWSEYAKQAKDLGSFAVFCTLAIFNAYVAVVVLSLTVF